MPAFYLLVIILAIFIWFCCIQYYEDFGKYLKDWLNEVKDVMTKEEDNDKKE